MLGTVEYFVDQSINGITLGAIYGLIAIGYTLVYGIIGFDGTGDVTAPGYVWYEWSNGTYDYAKKMM
jgi:hypothetical protein